MKDKEVTYKECNRIFVIRSSELESFSARKKLIPQYCPLCYKRYRAEKAAERKQREDLAWQKKKVLNGIIREGRFPDFNYTEFPKYSSLEI